MAVRSIRSDSLFAKLRISSSPQTVAREFVDEYPHNSFNMNMQLADLIFKACKLPCTMWLKLVEKEDVAGIVKLMEKLVESKKIDLNDSDIGRDMRDKILCFFEHYWSLNWANVVRDNKLVSFAENLVRELAFMKINSLRHFCLLVQLKVVTAFLKNRHMIHFAQQLQLMAKYAHSILVRSIYDTNKQLWIESLDELAKWFSLGEEFVVNDFLRFVVWSLRDTSAKVNYAGLKLTRNLLEDDERDLPETFALKVVETFAETAKTSSDKLFDSICKCCSLVHERFGDALLQDVKLLLEDRIFDLDTKKAKAAAKFWIDVSFGDEYDSPVSCYRRMIAFLEGRRSIFVELFVDSLMDVTPLLSDWHMLAKGLGDEMDERLTMKEKESLLLMTLFAIRLAVTKERPALRVAAATEIYEIDQRISLAITVAFKPRIKTIMQQKFNNLSSLLKLLSYFHFDTMDKAVIENLINSCHLTFDRFYDLPMRKGCLEFLVRIAERSSDTSIVKKCESVLKELMSNTERKFHKEFDELLQEPSLFCNTMRGKHLRDIVYSLRHMDAAIPINKEIAYDATISLLRHDLPEPYNAAFVLTREILIILCTKNVTRGLTAGQKESIRKAEFFIYNLTGNLDVYYRGRVGEVVFFSLCDLAECLAFLNQGERLPRVTMQKLPTYLLKTCRSIEATTAREKKAVMVKYLSMVEQKVFPLEYAYDALRTYCENENEDMFRGAFRKFLQRLCENFDVDTLADWLLVLLQRIFQLHGELIEASSLRMVAKVADLVYLVKSEMRNVLRKVHEKGIDYATAEAKRADFLYLISQFSWCLNLENKSGMRKYILQKPASNMKVVKFYLESLKYKGRIEVNLENNANITTSSSGSKLLSSPTSVPVFNQSGISENMDYEELLHSDDSDMSISSVNCRSPVAVSSYGSDESVWMSGLEDSSHRFM